MGWIIPMNSLPNRKSSYPQAEDGCYLLDCVLPIYENLVITIQLEILTQHIRSLQNLSIFLCKKKTKLDSLKSTAFLFAGIFFFHSRIERTGQYIFHRRSFYKINHEI